MMRQLHAIVLDTVREARARKVFLGMAMNGTISALLVLWYVQTVGSRAPASRLTAMARIDPRFLDDGFASHMVYSWAAAMLFPVQALFAITITLGLLAPLLSARRNAIPAAAPVPRAFILLGRYIGTLCAAAAGIGLAFGETWIATSLKLGVWHARFLWAAAVTMLAVAVAVALMALLQTAMKSQAMVLASVVAISLIDIGAQSPDRVREMTGSDWLARAAAGLGSVLPRFAEMAAWTRVFVATGDPSHSAVLWASAATGLVCLAAACVVFARSEF